MDLKNKHVTVVGLGNSGLSAAMLLDDIGAYVRITDSNETPDIRENVRRLEHRDIRLELGVHTKDFIAKSDLIVISPGVECSSSVIKWAREFNIPVISELELGFRFCKGKIIAVTGTNGKSTVTTLIGDILKCGGLDTVVCGNIGNALSGEITRIKNNTWVVLEVSSFQLERTKIFKPRIAIILNITDDHLDRYKTFDDYFKEKLKIFCNQDEEDTLILNHDAKELLPLKERANSKVLFYSKFNRVEGAYVKDGRITVYLGGIERESCEVNEIRLKGLHNLENVLASALAASLVDIDRNSIRDAIRNFKGLPHRFETIDIIDGVEYIDDSKGTTVDSTARALESCDNPVVLIAGGRDKNSDYSVIKNIVRQKVKCLVLIGEAKGKIEKTLGDVTKTREAKDMFEAVELASSLARANEIVLLSPMCSSFDMFKDYKERGEAFKEAVRRIKVTIG